MPTATVPTNPPRSRTTSSGGWLILIGVYKLCKAALMVLIAVGALRLVHQDVAAIFDDWITDWRIDPNNYCVHLLLEKLPKVDDRMLREISIGSFALAALLAVEGIGLCRRKHWAEWLTVVATAALVPLEIYELARHVTAPRIIVLTINLAVVWYLAARLRREQAERRRAAHPDASGDSLPVATNVLSD